MLNKEHTQRKEMKKTKKRFTLKDDTSRKERRGQTKKREKNV